MCFLALRETLRVNQNRHLLAGVIQNKVTMPKLQPGSAEEVGGRDILRTSFYVVGEILRANPHIDSMHVITYQEGRNWRDLTPPEVEPGLALSVRGLHQDRGERKHSQIESNKISPKQLQQLTFDLPRNRLLAIASDVRLRGGTMGHIPMMDFMCPPSYENQQALSGLLRELNHGRGFLLESGRSYHYYGFQIFDPRQWHAFFDNIPLITGFLVDLYVVPHLLPLPSAS